MQPSLYVKHHPDFEREQRPSGTWQHSEAGAPCPWLSTLAGAELAELSLGVGGHVPEQVWGCGAQARALRLAGLKEQAGRDLLKYANRRRKEEEGRGASTVQPW